MDMYPVQKIVASFSTGEIALGGTESQFDAMLALYFNSLDELHAGCTGHVPQLIAADEKNFVDSAPINIIAEEYVMSQKPGAEKILKKTGQLKIIRTVYRRKDLSHQQFKDYWLNNHSKLEDRVIAESPVQRIVATFAVPEPGKDPAFDGMVELYFANVADIRAMFAGPIPAMMRKDEENFVQMDAPAVRLVAEEFGVG